MNTLEITKAAVNAENNGIIGKADTKTHKITSMKMYWHTEGKHFMKLEDKQPSGETVMIYFPLYKGFQVYICNEFLRSLATPFDITFENHVQYGELIEQCFNYISQLNDVFNTERGGKSSYRVISKVSPEEAVNLSEYRTFDDMLIAEGIYNKALNYFDDIYTDLGFIKVSALAAVWNAGRVHGVREERAKRNQQG